ncbi:MAG: tetratricopeptide repeat protein [Pyrinomonadaceae bacterium]
MKTFNHLIKSIVLFSLIIAAATLAQAQNSSITGLIFDAQSRSPVENLYVELGDQLGLSLAQTRADSAGRFSFSGLRGGNYQIKVLTFGTNYKEEVQDVRLVTLPLGNGRYASDMAFVQFNLKLDPRKINIGSSGAATVVFAQEIPDDARKLYKKGVKQLEDKKDEGLDSLKQAVEIFPTYYDALDRLGSEYVVRKQYEEAAPYLTRAIDVNKRSYSSFYALGVASYNLKNMQAAAEALRAAVTINPKSVNAQLFYGMVLRIEGNFELSEKALLQAKSLSEKASPVAEIDWQLALLYEKTARYKEAADELERYLKVAPKEIDTEKIKKLIADLRAKAK